MLYDYTCPLCLKQLGRGDRLKVFKTEAHSSAKNQFAKKSVSCADDSFVEELLRFAGDAAFIPGEEHAVFVSHERCKALNPFWLTANSQISIPGKLEDGERLQVELTCRASNLSFQKDLYHWVINMLRATSALGNDYAPMWYPLSLLLATANVKGDSRTRPFGSLVEMASTKAAGKTILTLQMLNQALYRNGREMTTSDFFYPSADHTDLDLRNFKEKFYGELYFHSMWLKTPYSRPAGTTASPGDLRAISIQPVSHEAEGEATPTTTSRKATGRTVKIVGKALKIFFTETFLRGKSKSNGKKKELGPTFEELLRERRDDFWNPILFYDTAGELHTDVSRVTLSVRELTNKLAICIDAREVFNKYDALSPGEPPRRMSERNASIRHAYKRIKVLAMSRIHRKQTCIIITKLDLALSAEQKEEVIRITEDANADEEARELLIRWLSEHSDDDKKNLRSFLPAKRKLIDRVFFIWTENLPLMNSVRQSPIKLVTPSSGKCGDTIMIEANDGFDFQDVKRMTFNRVPSNFEIVSNKQIKAVVPDGATSGLIGIYLNGQIKGGPIAVTSTSYEDDATSEEAFEVEPEIGNDSGKPRSYGLTKFLAWCLDRPVGTISRPSEH
jgi:hypothetical protein